MVMEFPSTGDGVPIPVFRVKLAVPSMTGRPGRHTHVFLCTFFKMVMTWDGFCVSLFYPQLIPLLMGFDGF